MLKAVLRVTGSGRLVEFGERLRWLLVRDEDASRSDYSEHHAEGRLEYRFETQAGIPFPAFATASGEFPELRVEAEWENRALGVRGQAVIENGRLVDQQTAPLADSALGVAIDIGVGGALAFAFACIRRPADWLGYCADAGGHAYFVDDAAGLRIAQDAGPRWTHRVEAGGAARCDEPIDDALLAELEDVAFRFAADWLWYDQAPDAETALERKRYADHGWPVRGANLRSERILALGPGRRFETLAPEARPLLARLRATWESIQ